MDREKLQEIIEMGHRVTKDIPEYMLEKAYPRTACNLSTEPNEQEEKILKDFAEFLNKINHAKKEDKLNIIQEYNEKIRKEND